MYQQKDSKFKSQVPPASQYQAERDEEMIRLEQQVVVSSLLKTSDEQELIGYGQEDDDYQMMGEQHYPGEVTLNNNNFD